MHDIVLQEFERVVNGGGWLIACVYLVCGAMRLARFNCLAARENKDPDSAKSFRGCPIPAAAGVIVSLTLTLLWLDGENREIGRWKYALPVLMLLLSYLMVSSLEYPSFKAINFRTKRSFHWVLISILVVALLTISLAMDADRDLRLLPALWPGASVDLPQMAAGNRGPSRSFPERRMADSAATSDSEDDG